MSRFAQKAVLVTGGGSGVGAAICRAFAAEGARVLVADVQGDRAKDVAEGLCGDGFEARALVADTSTADGCKAMVDTALSAFGGLDIAVNNAGIPSAPYAFFDEADPEDWERVMAVNLRGPFLAMREEARVMRAARRGAIVNIASMMSFSALPGMASYIASKQGLAGLTQAVAADLAPHGIRVNAVCPGFVDTPMLRPALEQEQARDAVLRSVPLGRVASAQEIASAVLFVASDEASYMIGSLVRVDGGSTLA